MLFKIIKIWLMFKVITTIVLIPTALGGEESSHQYLILVKLSEKKIYLSSKGSDIVAYPIAVPKHKYHLPIVGELVKIEINPFWYPTPKTRAAYLKKKGIELPAVIKPFNQDSRNAMGKAKLVIKFDRPVDPIRIHGTNEPNSIGKKITRGCIRLQNQDILELASTIKESKTRVIIDD